MQRQKRLDTRSLRRVVYGHLYKLQQDVWAKGKSLSQPCCRLASGYLREYLEEEGLEVTTKTSKMHEYLEVAGLIVDPTIQQFFIENMPPIFIGDRKELEILFESSNRWLPLSVNQIYLGSTFG